MNLFTDMLFILTWIVLFIFAIRTMFRGWNAVKESSTQGYSVEKRTVTKMPHPEMADVKNGDELLVVNFNRKPVIKDRGSAIFLHIANKKFSPTKGCIAIQKKNFIKILPYIRKKTKIFIS